MEGGEERKLVSSSSQGRTVRVELARPPIKTRTSPRDGSSIMHTVVHSPEGSMRAESAADR